MTATRDRGAGLWCWAMLATLTCAPAALANEPAAPAKASKPTPKVENTAAKKPAAKATSAPKASVRPGSTRMAQTNGAGSPMSMPVARTAATAPGSTLAHLDEHTTYQYNALGRRDPFEPLVGGDFVGMDQGGDAPPDPGGIKVVGIVWGPTDQFALVEDVKGNSYVLRKGDKVQNGWVESLKRDGIVVTVQADGQSQSVLIPLTRKGDGNAR